MALTAVGLAVVVAAWRRAHRSAEPFGATPLVVVSALLVTAPLLSPQFLLWLLPAIALVPSGHGFPLGERVLGIATLAFGLTAVTACVLPSVLMGEPAALLLVVLRNGVLVALVAAAWAVGSPTPAWRPDQPVLAVPSRSER
jgi:hypothetical protein